MKRKYDCFFCGGAISLNAWQGKLSSGITARTECQLCQRPVCEKCSKGFLLEIEPEERSEVFKICGECAPDAAWLDTAAKVMQAPPRIGFCYACETRSPALIAVGRDTGPRAFRPGEPRIGRIRYCDICEVRLCPKCVRPFQINGVLCPTCFDREKQLLEAPRPVWACPFCGKSWHDFPPERFTCPVCRVEYCLSCRVGRRLQGNITMVCLACTSRTDPL
ncbi:MAG: hypothetical protein GX442_14030 [Candidatus Riflebacteria bacterium]|nr:hypothetical protein [Candidatus Riflebacteria bacterium]